MPSHQPPDGDTEFDRLVTAHQQRIYFFIRSMVFNPDDARDTLQDVNIVLYRKKESYTHGTNFKAWAFAIARFECLTYLSRYKKKQWATLDTGLLETIAEKAEETADDAEPWLLALRQCMQKLTPDARKVIHARYQTKTPLEISAAREGTTVGAIKQKLFRARRQLRECITRRLERERVHR